MGISSGCSYCSSSMLVNGFFGYHPYCKPDMLGTHMVVLGPEGCVLNVKFSYISKYRYDDFHKNISILIFKK